MSAASNSSRVRPLYDWEVAQAHIVFGGALRFEKVRVHECAAWPDAIDRLGRRLKHMPPPDIQDHNAITLGYNSYFPVQFPATVVPLGQPQDYVMGWLIHELTHAWQYQHTGWTYLLRALSAQIRLGADAYDFGGPDGLLARRQEGWTFHSFNLEQQGDITRSYYEAQRAGQDVSAWLPYIQDIQSTA